MSLLDAVKRAGSRGDFVTQPQKKRFSELLSKYLAEEVANGLRQAGFKGTKPDYGMPGEKQFQGGLGPKRVDVSFSDDRHGLKLAVSIKTISYGPYGKNLKNRFGDLCTEAITLHMRFPYSVVCALFAFPSEADADSKKHPTASTFRRAMALFSTISGRQEYTDPGEKFEHFALLLYEPGNDGGEPTLRIFDAPSRQELTEDQYFAKLREIYNDRNPHDAIGPGILHLDEE